MGRARGHTSPAAAADSRFDALLGVRRGGGSSHRDPLLSDDTRERDAELQRLLTLTRDDPQQAWTAVRSAWREEPGNRHARQLAVAVCAQVMHDTNADSGGTVGVLLEGCGYDKREAHTIYQQLLSDTGAALRNDTDLAQDPLETVYARAGSVWQSELPVRLADCALNAPGEAVGRLFDSTADRVWLSKNAGDLRREDWEAAFAEGVRAAAESRTIRGSGSRQCRRAISASVRSRLEA